MPKPITIEPEIVVNANAASEDAASQALAAAAARSPARAGESTPDPRLDGAAPGEVFARTCLGCQTLKQTADQSGKTLCRACRVKAGEPYEAVALPPAPENPSTGLVAPGIEVSRVDRLPLR